MSVVPSTSTSKDPHRIVHGDDFGWKTETLPYKSIPELFRLRVKELGDATMMRQKELGIWRAYSWNEVCVIVGEIGAGLASLSFEPGEVASVLSNTCREWVWCDLAVQQAMPGHGSDETSGKLPLPEGHSIEKPQRRDGAVDRRRTRTFLVLVDLEATQILWRCRVGRAAEKAGEPADVATILLLRARQQPAHHHVLLHALTERLGGGNGRDRIHGKVLWLKRTSPSAHDSAGLKARRYANHS